MSRQPQIGGTTPGQVPPGDWPEPPQQWPALMSAATAAKYLGERSVKSFRRKVGKVYPRPVAHVEGRGDVWRKADLDQYLASLSGTGAPFDAADIL